MKKLTALFLTIPMAFSLAACSGTNFTPAPSEEERDQPQAAATDSEREYDENDPSAMVGEITNFFSDVLSGSENSGDNMSNETTSPAQNDNADSTAGGIRPEFKEAMDSYEVFYTEYCDFMKKYSENPTDLTLLVKYADMLGKAEEMDKAFEAWDEDELTNEETKYYIDVNNRVMKMLVDAVG